MNYKKQVLQVYPGAQVGVWTFTDYFSMTKKIYYYVECKIDNCPKQIGPRIANRKNVWKECFINIQEQLIHKLAE